MTKKNARKTAARALQAKTGGRYQSALRAQGPDNAIRRRHEGLMRIFEHALVQCEDSLDKWGGYDAYPKLHLDLTFYFPEGRQIRCFPVHDLKDPVPENLDPRATLVGDVNLGPPIYRTDPAVGEGPESPITMTPSISDPAYSIPTRTAKPQAPADLKARMLEAFMVLNSGLGFTGHLAPTREQLLARINQALVLLAGDPDEPYRFQRTLAGRELLEKGFKVAAGFTPKQPLEGFVTREQIDATMSKGIDPVKLIDDAAKMELFDQESRRIYPFRIDPPDALRNWGKLAVLKRCTAPKLRLIGVTDGTTVRWAILTSCKDDPEFMSWWPALPQAEPYARFDNDSV